MTHIEIQEEKKSLKLHYEAIKKYLGELLLEHNAKEDNPEDFAYFSRKFEETRNLLRKHGVK
jgi:hypothetical protein